MKFKEFVTMNATKFQESERSILLGEKKPIKIAKYGFFRKLSIIPLLSVAFNKIYAIKVLLLMIFWGDFIQYSILYPSNFERYSRILRSCKSLSPQKRHVCIFQLVSKASDISFDQKFYANVRDFHFVPRVYITLLFSWVPTFLRKYGRF